LPFACSTQVSASAQLVADAVENDIAVRRGDEEFSTPPVEPRLFANSLDYVRMWVSSSFGKMFSVLGGSVFLPFVPMAPIQILTNNLL
jgi:hypothetical protein